MKISLHVRVHIKTISRSHHYAQFGNALQKHFFAYSALIMGTLQVSTGRFLNFSAQSQNFIGRLNGPDLPQSSDTVKNQCQQKEVIYASFET